MRSLGHGGLYISAVAACTSRPWGGLCKARGREEDLPPGLGVWNSSAEGGKGPLNPPNLNRTPPFEGLADPTL